MARFLPPNTEPYAKVYFCHYGKPLLANRGLKFAVDFENVMLNVPNQRRTAVGFPAKKVPNFSNEICTENVWKSHI